MQTLQKEDDYNKEKIKCPPHNEIITNNIQDMKTPKSTSLSGQEGIVQTLEEEDDEKEEMKMQ